MPLLRLLTILLVAIHLYFHSYTVLRLLAFLGIGIAAVITAYAIREVLRS